MVVRRNVVRALALALPTLDVRVDGPALIGPGRTRATSTVRSSRFSGSVRTSICICARLSIWKTPDRVGGLDLPVDLFVVERNARQIDRLSAAPRDRLDALLDGGEHAEPEQVDLEKAGVCAGVLVPLAELATLHRGRDDGDELHERTRRDHHSAWMLGDVAWKPGDLGAQLGKSLPARGAQLLRSIWKRSQLAAHLARVPAVREARKSLELRLRETQRLADLPDGATRAVGGEAGDEGRVLAAVALRDGDDQLLADIARKIQIDIRYRRELPVEKSSRAADRLRRDRRGRGR